VVSVPKRNTPLEKRYRGVIWPWSKEWRGRLSGTGNGRGSETDSVPALVRFGNGLRGTGGRLLIVSGWGLVIEAPDAEVRDTGASWDTGGCGGDGTYASVAGGGTRGVTGVGATGACSTMSSWTPNSRFHASRPPMSNTGTRLRDLRNAVSYIARMSLASGASGGPGVSEASS
jgi:hypothetical protein